MQDSETQYKNKKKQLESDLKGLEDEQRKNETKEIQELRERYKEEKAATSKF